MSTQQRKDGGLVMKTRRTPDEDEKDHIYKINEKKKKMMKEILIFDYKQISSCEIGFECHDKWIHSRWHIHLQKNNG